MVQRIFDVIHATPLLMQDVPTLPLTFDVTARHEQDLWVTVGSCAGREVQSIRQLHETTILCLCLGRW